MVTNPYLAAPGPRSRNARRGALGALNFPMLDPQVMAMLEQMQAGAAQQSAMPQFGAAVAPLGGAVTQPTMMDGAAGPAGPKFQQTAGAPSWNNLQQWGHPEGAPENRRPTPRQPQPGESAQRSGAGGSGRIELFDVKPETFAATPPAALDETPIAPVAKTPEPTLKDRIANFGQRAITPNEKTGISAVDGLIAAAQMIEAGQPTWDLSPQNHGMAGVAAALGGMMETGRERVRQKKADERDDARFAFEQRDQAFRGEEQVRARDVWKTEDERKRAIATAILDPNSGFTAEERAALQAATPDQQAEILLKKGMIGQRGIRSIADGRYITTDWRGDMTEGDFTPGGAQNQKNIDAQLLTSRINANRSGATPIGPAGARQFRNDYERKVAPYQEVLTNLGKVGESPDTLRNIIASGGRRPAQNWGRVDDAQLLFTVARAIQGTGVLSDSDISVLSGRDRTALMADVQGWLQGGDTNVKLSDGQRLQMARIAQRGIEGAQREVWNVYDEHAAFAESNNINREQAGIIAPRFSRPAERAATSATPTQQNIAELQMRRNDAGAIASFDARFGAGAAARYLSQPNAPRPNPQRRTVSAAEARNAMRGQ